MPEDDPAIERLHSAINDILGGFCTKWVIVADITDPESGENQLHSAHAGGMALWDTLGLLRFAERLTELKVEAPWGDDEEGGE